jgi:hypothetical protein
MSSNPTGSRPAATAQSAEEPKNRGANRSTKVAGKLKVLPEQPEPEPVPARRALLAPSDKGDGSTSSDEEEGEDEELEDGEVCPV